MSEREHAKLSASGAKRWLACPRSVALEETVEETTSEFAEEGTLAHGVSEILLRNALGLLDNDDAHVALQDLCPPNDMIDYAKDYVENCVDSYQAAKLEDPDAFALIEVRVEFTDWIPEGFGTCDFMIITRRKLIIRDLKYGKGVPVSAVDNPQIRIYALGAIQEYGWIYDIEEIEMHIDQPRLRNSTTEVMTIKELLAWAETEVKPKALLAYHDEGEFVPGPHCQFCRVRATCKKRAFSTLETIQNIIIGDPKNGKK